MTSKSRDKLNTSETCFKKITASKYITFWITVQNIYIINMIYGQLIQKNY